MEQDEQLDPLFLHLSAFQRLIINSLCLISSTIVGYVWFVLVQLWFFVKYQILRLPHPEKPKVPSPYELWGKKKEELQEAHEMPQLMISRREKAILELVTSERIYHENLDNFGETYQPAMESILKDDARTLFFADFTPLYEVSIKMYVLLNQEMNNGAKYAMIGKVFVDQLEDIVKFIPYVMNYVDIALTYDNLYATQKKFKEKVKGLARRNQLAPIDVLRLPVQRLVKYSSVLTELLKNTPDWHSDHETLVQALEQLKSPVTQAEFALDESDRRVGLCRLERKIRKCPPLETPDRRVIGEWPLTEENYFLYVLSDLILILQRKVELLTRRKYFIIKREIPMQEVASVSREKNGIKLKIPGKTDIAIMISLKGDEAMDAITGQIAKRT